MGDENKVEGGNRVEGVIPPVGESLYERHQKQEAEKVQVSGKGNVQGDVKSESTPNAPVNPMPPQAAEGHVSENIKQFTEKETPSQSGQTQSFVENESATEAFERKPVEDLVFLGKVEKVIDFHGHRLELQTLTGAHNLDIIDEVSHFDPPTRLAASAIGSMVRAIKSFNGQKLYAENPKERTYSKFESIDDAKAWILSWQQPLIDELYTLFTDLVETQESELEEVKN